MPRRLLALLSNVSFAGENNWSGFKLIRVSLWKCQKLSSAQQDVGHVRALETGIDMSILIDLENTMRHYYRVNPNQEHLLGRRT